MNYHWIELLKFIKNNILKIIASTVVFTVLFVLFINFTKQTVQDSDNSTGSDNELVDYIISTNPSNFFFYIEYQDGKSFENNFLIEQYILKNDILSEVSSNVNFELLDFIEETENLVNISYKESNESKAITVTRNETTHLMEFSVNVGNESKNSAIAEYYFEFIKNGNIPFLTDKNLYVLKEPAIQEIETTFDPLLTSKDLLKEESKSTDFLIAISLGAMISTLFFIMITFFSKKLIYSFSYNIDEDNTFILIDKKINNDRLERMIRSIKDINKAVVYENSRTLSETSDANISKIIDGNSKRYNNIINAVNSKANIIIIVVEENKTSREWYSSQIKLARNSKTPIFILQFNQ